MKIPRFDDYLSRKLKDPQFKRGFDEWDIPVRNSIQEIDKRIKLGRVKKKLARKSGIT